MEIVGHTPNLQLLSDLLARNQLPHALLFTGPSGVGKSLVARDFAQTLLCTKRSILDGSTYRPCENCISCQKVARNQHPDLFVVEPENHILKIEAIRNLKEKLALKPFESSLKIAILNQADCLNAAASNALLKTLEEPSAGTLLILTSSSPHRLLKTILSRCQKIYFSPLKDFEVIQILKQNFPERNFDRTILEKLPGSAGFVASLSEEALEYVQRKILPHFQRKEKDLLRLLDLAEEIAKEELLHASILSLLSLEWHQKMLREPTMQMAQKIEAIEKARRALERNANPLLTFENLFMEL